MFFATNPLVFQTRWNAVFSRAEHWIRRSRARKVASGRVATRPMPQPMLDHTCTTHTYMALWTKKKVGGWVDISIFPKCLLATLPSEVRSCDRVASGEMIVPADVNWDVGWLAAQFWMGSGGNLLQNSQLGGGGTRPDIFLVSDVFVTSFFFL